MPRRGQRAGAGGGRRGGGRQAGRLAGPGVGEGEALLVAHAAGVAERARPLRPAPPLRRLVRRAVPARHPPRPPPSSCCAQPVCSSWPLPTFNVLQVQAIELILHAAGMDSPPSHSSCPVKTHLLPIACAGKGCSGCGASRFPCADLRNVFFQMLGTFEGVSQGEQGEGSIVRAPFLLPGLRLWEPPSVVMESASLSVAAPEARLSSLLAHRCVEPARRISARTLCDSPAAVRRPVAFALAWAPACTCRQHAGTCQSRHVTLPAKACLLHAGRLISTAIHAHENTCAINRLHRG